MGALLDNIFIDIAIAFALTYALLSLLVMRVQETVHGNWMAGRVQNLHRLVEEAVMKDAALARQVLENPLLGSLYEADEPRKGSWLIFRPKGPSEIPADLFARALLMELSPDRRPPSETTTPSEFIDQLDKDNRSDTPRGRLALALRGLLPGHEGDWKGFEAAIAAWFESIGERSKGWWKRRSSMAGFWIALIVCAALNVDAGRIATAFGEDAELRDSFVRIADGIEDVRAQDAKAAAASAPAAPGTVATVVDPATRALSRLNDASAMLFAAYKRDVEIRKYGFYAGTMAVCGADVEDQLRPKAGVDTVADEEGKYLSNSDTWLRTLPFMLGRIEKAINGDVDDATKPTEPAQRLREARRCVTDISAWVRAARGVSAQGETRRLMNEAAVALEDTKIALSLLVRTADAGLNARRLFAADPAVYSDCIQAGPTTLSALAQCMQARRNPVSRLPIGLTAANRRAQFCESEAVCVPKSKAASTAAAAASGTRDSARADAQGEDNCSPRNALTKWADRSMCNARADAVPLLRLPAYELRFAGVWSILGWMMGVLVSAFFVSLGAPFWFDVLSKVMRVRASVSAQDDRIAKVRGEGTKALPDAAPAAMPASASPAAAREGGTDGQASTLPRVVGSGNDFEDKLSVREVQALQQKLGVKATGVLDAATRTAIANETRERGFGETQYLNAATYLALVGRPAISTKQPVSGLPSGRLVNGQTNPQIPSLVAHLTSKMGVFNHAINPNATTLDDDTRALCVLWRYKTDTTTPLRSRKVFGMARSNPAQFDEVDQTLLQEITAPSTPATLVRDVPAWLDWAIGELGQVEKDGHSRGTSNLRVCAYLDAARSGLGDQGDHTPWCGGFVSWVLTQHTKLDKGALTAGLPATPERAQNWEKWPGGAASSAANPTRGDVVVVAVDGGHHVGFAFEVDVPGDAIWVLGGNQNKGTCVCLSKFPLSKLTWAATPT